MPIILAVVGVLVVVVALLGLVVARTRRDLQSMRSAVASLHEKLRDVRHPLVDDPPDGPRPTDASDGRRPADGRPVSVITDLGSDLTAAPRIRLATVTLDGPMIKVAAFSHGVRRALAEESRTRVRTTMRRELKHQRRHRRKQPPPDVRRADSQAGWLS